jgi:hypothetical protein
MAGFGVWRLELGTGSRDKQGGMEGQQRWVCNHTREVVMACMVHRVFPLRSR